MTRRTSVSREPVPNAAQKKLKEQAPWRDSHRRQANQFRARALHYLQLEDMVDAKNPTTRPDVLKDVVARQSKNKRGCLELPLNIAFFVLYAFAARLHEDITNVWLLESAMRHKLGTPLESVNTIDDVWAWMDGDMVSSLFVEKNMYGESVPLPDRGRVMFYNQIQGSVIVQQSRDKPGPFGVPYVGPKLPPEMEAWGKSKEGFIPKTDASKGGGASTSRRLSTVEAMWFAKGMTKPVKDDQKYEISLYPSVPVNDTKAMLWYLQQRRWLDEHTTKLRIIMLLLNGELGRPRLEQMVIELSFSRGGGIFSTVSLQALFLKHFPSGMVGLVSMGVDACWLIMLAVNSYFCVKTLWAAFIESQLRRHLSSPMVPMEWLIMALGWINVFGFLLQKAGGDTVLGSIQTLRKTARTLNVTDVATYDKGGALETQSEKLHADSNKLITVMEYARLGIAWMTLVLIFRFFSSFRLQPRLAVVTNTLRAVVPDLSHFLVVFLPTFFAYAISGHLLFGRRLESFATIQGAAGVCLRICYENEYEWMELSEVHFWEAAAWVWSFLLVVVLIMVNMVLAIVLDIYNEVRSGTDASQTIFLFAAQMFQQAKHFKQWVSDSDIGCLYAEGADDTTALKVENIIEAIPNITPSQQKMLLKACNLEMAWRAKEDLVSSNYLKFGASIKLSLDDASSLISMIDRRVHQGDEKSPTSPGSNKGSGYGGGSFGAAQGLDGTPRDFTPIKSPRRLVGVARPFPGQPPVPGGYSPPLFAPTTEHPNIALPSLANREACKDEPPWVRTMERKLQDVVGLQEDIQWSLESLHWQWHQLNVQTSQQVYGNARGRTSVCSSIESAKIADGNAVL